MKNWNWIVGILLDVLIILSTVMVLHKNNIKCRIYEDDVETWVPDLNGNIRRKENKTIVINYFNEIE